MLKLLTEKFLGGGPQKGKSSPNFSFKGFFLIRNDRPDDASRIIAACELNEKSKTPAFLETVAKIFIQTIEKTLVKEDWPFKI